MVEPSDESVEQVASRHDLYGVEPASFVAARDALARRLKAEKRKDEAGEVKKLRRPSPTVWALNQLSRRRPDDLRRLGELTDQMRDAQASALRGDKAALRSIREDRHRALLSLAKAAAGWTASELGGTAHAGDEVTAALDAALLDPSAASDLQRGELDAVPSATTGWDNLTALFAAGDPDPKPDPRPDRDPGVDHEPGPETEPDSDPGPGPDDRSDDEADEAADAAHAAAEQERRRQAVEAARQALSAAEQARDAATRRVEDLQSQLAAATDELATAAAVVDDRAAELDRTEG